jgi:carbonic anhydrase
MDDVYRSNGEFLKLIKGNEEFRSKNREFKELAQSQKPEFVVISCSDSRVSPSIILNAPLGSIFEIRVAGEVLDDYTIGSVEFAIDKLGTRKVLVMGHTGCGAVTAAYEALNNSNQIDVKSPLSSLVKNICRIVSEIKDTDLSLDKCIRENTMSQASRLFDSEVVKKLFESGQLNIAGALYHIDSGEVELFPLTFQSQ